MVANLPVVKRKIWKFPEESELSEGLLAAASGSEILAKLMIRRGIDTAEKAEAFLDPSNYEPTSPMAFAQMDKAIIRITQAIAQKEKITVYGDYDVDGVTATSVMLTVLKQLGANVDFYIPNRATEGYGLNLKAVSILASKQRTKLIITCDCGISNFSEINLAKSLGVETIIVDHHSMPELLPPAVAILHPKQFAEDHPLFHLPGVGVAYKLAEALLLDNKLPDEVAKLHDFVTLGMIADMVPLVKENRYLVQIGLPTLVNSPRAGIKALLDNTVKMDGTDIVGFGLAPRINAVGRLADAGLAVKLMTVEDETEAQELAQKLENENARRQELCEQIFFEADQKAKIALADSNDCAIAIYSPSWHHGVVGIVASRLVEKYHCPVFIAELDQEEGKIKGSARGVSGIDLYQILKANDSLMLKWGGHQMAAGFSAEAANADALCRALVDTCNRALAGQSQRPLLEIDLALSSDEVDLGLAKLIRKLGPFGMWNKKPVLAMESLQVLSSRPLGKEGKHHRLMLRSADGVQQFECVYWRSTQVPGDGEEIDLAFSPDVNVFNNTERLQLVLNDWRRSGEIEIEEPELLDFTPPEDAALAAVSAGSESAAKASPASGAQASRSSDPRADVPPPPAASIKGGESVQSNAAGSANYNSTLAAQPMTQRVVQFETQYDGKTASTSVSEIILPVQDVEKDSTAELIDMDPNSDDSTSSGVVVGGEDLSEPPRPDLIQRPAARAAVVSEPGGSVLSARGAAIQMSWKDLRGHASALAVADAAVRKLGSQLGIFGEACKLKEHHLVDRSSLEAKQHLLIWQYPPSLQVFRSIISKSQASHIYLCGAAATEDYDVASFLKRLLAMIRFAVNQREGQAHAEKMCAGLATTKMALALGLTLLKKTLVIDWYAEDSVIFLDILGAQADGCEDHPEYRQLANTLKEITEFRAWCAEAPLDEIQSELVPNSIRLSGTSVAEASQESLRNDTNSRANYYDRASHQPSQP